MQDTLNQVRLGVWRRQPAAFFDPAILDVDGVLAETYGECKQGIGLAYDGTWGYHPLVVSLAHTQEPLYLANRSGNRPSHEGAAAYLDRGIALCRRAGFRSILLRGDTDFSQTQHLDRWDTAGVQFLFGLDAMRNLIARARTCRKRPGNRCTGRPSTRCGPPRGSGRRTSKNGSSSRRVPEHQAPGRGGGHVRLSAHGV